jgi:hypothetical protein
VRRARSRAMVDGFEKAFDADLHAAATAQQMNPRT